MFQTGTDITDALQGQINRLAAAGGGEVVVPPGQYSFRPVELKSNLCLTLSAGARLTASPRREDYFPVGHHHNEMGEVHSAFYAIDQEHITLRGQGVLDLNGAAFYHMHRPSEVTTAGPEITAAHREEAPRTYDWRVNQPVFFHRCRNVRIDGLTIVVSSCIFQSASKALSVGYRHSIVRNVVIDDVIVRKSNRAFVSMCHPRTGLVENVRVSNCLFEGRSYGNVIDLAPGPENYPVPPGTAVYTRNARVVLDGVCDGRGNSVFQEVLP